MLMSHVSSIAGSDLPLPAGFERVACDLCGRLGGEPFLEKDGGYYTRCADCGFVYSNPREKDPEGYNDENNAALKDKYVAKQYSKRHQRRYGKLLKRFERYRRQGRILEIGSNVGGFLYRAAQTGWETSGVEPVDAVAAYGREKHGLDVRSCVLEAADYPADEFDVVFSNAVLEHLPSPAAVMEEAYRVLRPGGVFYADTVNIASYTFDHLGASWKLIDPRAHLSLFTPDTLRRFCETKGFDVLRITTHGIRLRPNKEGALKGLARWGEELKKLPYSLAARFTLKGASIAVLAQKPFA